MLSRNSRGWWRWHNRMSLGVQGQKVNQKGGRRRCLVQSVMTLKWFLNSHISMFPRTALSHSNEGYLQLYHLFYSTCHLPLEGFQTVQILDGKNWLPSLKYFQAKGQYHGLTRYLEIAYPGKTPCSHELKLSLLCDSVTALGTLYHPSKESQCSSSEHCPP